MISALNKVTSFLDRQLRVADFPDLSHNGLQVQNSGKLRRICLGVDASLAFFEQAAKRKADLVICHHGLSWGDSLKRITGLNYRRLRFLLEHDMALYACHLPLDAHPHLGNNAQICQALGLRGLKPFGLYHGLRLGFEGQLPKTISYLDFKKLSKKIFGNMLATLDFGKARVRRVAVISGGAGDVIAEAGQQGLDVYVSGEPQLTAWHLAQEYEINAVFAGHYATEVFGLKALAKRLASEFRLSAEFIDLQIPL